MIAIDFQPHGVCARNIHIELDDSGETIESVRFDGGCPGNTTAVSKLIKGQSVDRIVELLQGNDCRGRGTSCADQMTIGLRIAQGMASA